MSQIELLKTRIISHCIVLREAESGLIWRCLNLFWKLIHNNGNSRAKFPEKK